MIFHPRRPTSLLALLTALLIPNLLPAQDRIDARAAASVDVRVLHTVVEDDREVRHDSYMAVIGNVRAWEAGQTAPGAAVVIDRRGSVRGLDEYVMRPAERGAPARLMLFEHGIREEGIVSAEIEPPDLEDDCPDDLPPGSTIFFPCGDDLLLLANGGPDSSGSDRVPATVRGPVEGVSVALADERGRPGGRGVTDENGRVRFRALRGELGRQTLVLAGGGLRPTRIRLAPHVVEVTPPRRDLRPAVQATLEPAGGDRMPAAAPVAPRGQVVVLEPVDSLGSTADCESGNCFTYCKLPPHIPDPPEPIEEEDCSELILLQMNPRSGGPAPPGSSRPFAVLIASCMTAGDETGCREDILGSVQGLDDVQRRRLTRAVREYEAAVQRFTRQLEAYDYSLCVVDDAADATCGPGARIR